MARAVGQGCRGRLVDDTQHVEASDATRILGGLTLRIVEVSGHRYDGVVALFAEVVLGGLLHLLEHPGADFGRAVVASAQPDPGIAGGRRHDFIRDVRPCIDHSRCIKALADQALDGNRSVLPIGDCLALRNLTNQPLAALGKGDNRRGGAAALTVGENQNLTVYGNCDARVRGPQINANNSAHSGSPQVGNKVRLGMRPCTVSQVLPCTAGGASTHAPYPSASSERSSATSMTSPCAACASATSNAGAAAGAAIGEGPPVATTTIAGRRSLSWSL